jgi:transcriptional regulator with PAS, ATPase and Fis domain
VDPSSKVIFANNNCVTAFGVPRDQIIGHTTQDLVDSGILTRSTSQECLDKKDTIIGTVKSQLGIEMLNISRPIYDENGKLSFIMTYGQTSDKMGEFLNVIEEEKKKTQNYKDALMRINNMESNGKEVVIACEKMRKLFSQLERVAPTDGTIMLYGESGVGKDVIANYIHKASLRKDEPFIPVNCAAIPSELMESEFFGYEKGAFTGARVTGKAGLFELASKGTLFLDEIGELPPETQAKFLRAIETGMVTRIGGHKQIKTDVRIIAATNRNLMNMIREKTFREDLYFRLNVLSYHIPPLRERTEEIDAFVETFLQRYNKKYGKSLTLSKQTMANLRAYKWYGNVRELKNVIERMVLTSDEEFAQLELNEIPQPSQVRQVSETDTMIGSSVTKKSIEERYREAEREKVIEVLLSVNGNKSKAAQLLGISRGKLYKLLREE